MRVAFYCANQHLPKVDFSQPIKGNPGCGAAEYLHVCIPFMLSRSMSDLIEPIILADNILMLEKHMKYSPIFPNQKP